MNKAKSLADFLAKNLKFPEPLLKGAQLFFVFQLTKWLDRLNIPYGLREIDARPSKAKMFIVGWDAEAEELNPDKIVAVEIDHGFFYNEGDFVAQEENRRIQTIEPITKYDLGKRVAQSTVSRGKRAQIVSYIDSLSSSYYLFLAKRAKPTPEPAIEVL